MSNNTVFIGLETLVAATMAGVGFVWYSESNTKAAVSKCAKAYYSADDYKNYHSAEDYKNLAAAAFVKCMKSEFPNAFSTAAKTFVGVEEFK